MLQELLENRRVKVVAIGIAAAFLLLVVLSLFLRTDSLELVPTSLPYDEASVQLRDDTIYGYNGSAFYTIPFSEAGAPQVLFSGKRLPKPSAVVWAGKKGVLLNFSESYINTPVFDYIIDERLDYDEASTSTWYLDFATKQLSYVGLHEIYDNKGYYDERSGSIYYFEKGVSEGSAGYLHRFEVASKKDTTNEAVTNYSEFRSLGRCPSTNTADVFCFTAKQDDVETSGLFALARQGTVRKLLDVKGTILPTGSLSSYLLLRTADINTEDADEAGPIVYTKAELRNLDTKQSMSIKRNFSLDTFLVHNYEGDKLAIIGDNTDSYTVVTPGLFGPRIANKSIDARDIVIRGIADSKTMLIQSSEETSFAYTRDGSFNSYLRQEKVDADKISACDASAEGDETTPRLFTFYLTDDETFNDQVADISQCLAKDPTLTTGYTYVFASVDPASGRITSD